MKINGLTPTTLFEIYFRVKLKASLIAFSILWKNKEGHLLGDLPVIFVIPVLLFGEQNPLCKDITSSSIYHLIIKLPVNCFLSPSVMRKI